MRAETGGLTAADERLAPLTEAVRRAVGERRRLAPRGAASWWTDLPAGVAAVAAPAGIVRFDPSDQVATAGAATPVADLAAAFAAQGAFVALDPPGGSARTLGGALAAASAGPLAAGFGPPRDQVLGLSLVAGNGTAVTTGGRVVKNVAGFDLAKVVVGSCGGFGVIGDVHLRLRALPPADATLAWSGPAARVRDAADRMRAAMLSPAALEVVSPGLAQRCGLPAAWTLLVRAFGTGVAVEEELAAAQAAAAATGCDGPEPVAGVWPAWGPAVGAAPVLLRIGADPAAWHDALALAGEHLGGPDVVSVTVPRGTVRAGVSAAAPAAIAQLRAAAARRGWPVTLERAPAAVLAEAGVWGALPDGVLRLAQRLREAFDPNGVFDAPLWSDGKSAGR